MIIKRPELVAEIKPENEEFLSKKLKSLVGRIKKEAGTQVMAQLTATAEPEVAMNLEFAYLRSQELWKDFKDQELAVEFQKLLAQIQKRKVSAQLESMAYDIRVAEKAGEKKKLAELVNEFSIISKKL